MKKRMKIVMCLAFASVLLSFGGNSVINIQAEEQITEKEEQHIRAEENTLCLTVGDTFCLNAMTDGDGSLSYMPADEEVASVDENGVVEAYRAGETSIIIRAEETDRYKEAEITVNVIVTKKTQKITVSDTEVYYGDDTRILQAETSGNAALYFAVENPDIAEIDEQGQITPKKVGKTVITVTAGETEEYSEAVCQITLTVKSSLEPPVLSKVSGANGSIYVAWEKVAKASGYYLYQKIGSGSYKRIAVIENADVLNYTQKKVKSGTGYSYQVAAYSDNGNNVSDKSKAKTGKYLLAPSVSTRVTVSKIEVKWTQATGASGYYVYRKEYGSKSWNQMAKLTAGTSLSWTDTSAANGKKYTYSVKAYYEDSESVLSDERTALLLASPSVTGLSKKNTKMTVKWSRNTLASGYQIQYAPNRLFHGAKTITVSNNRTTSKTVAKLSKKKTYYVRIRAYAKTGGQTYYSVWSLSGNTKKTQNASSQRLKCGKKIFELRAQAKQKLYDYDTVQGGCSDGVYAYYVLYNRKVEKCKIAKVKLSNMKVVKVSGVMNISHGNDLTYNSHTKRLIVTHTNVHTKRVSVINPNTLKEEQIKDIAIPSKLAGVSDADLKNVKGFAGIAYSSGRKQYAAFLKSTGDILILDRNLNPVSYIKPSKKSGLTKQGMDVTDDYILLGYSGKTNIIMVYTWDGDFVAQINVKKGYELENIYHVGSQYYATYYTSYYKTYYTTEKKTKIVKGKKKKVKVRVKHRKLMRDNYVYKISGF